MRELNWLGDAPLGPEGLDAEVKIRSAATPAAATIHASGAGRARIVFHEPQEGVAPGQACVIYQRDRVMGGGWIERDAAMRHSLELTPRRTQSIGTAPLAAE